MIRSANLARSNSEIVVRGSGCCWGACAPTNGTIVAEAPAAVDGDEGDEGVDADVDADADADVSAGVGGVTGCDRHAESGIKHRAQ